MCSNIGVVLIISAALLKLSVNGKGPYLKTKGLKKSWSWSDFSKQARIYQYKNWERAINFFPKME